MHRHAKALLLVVMVAALMSVTTIAGVAATTVTIAHGVDPESLDPALDTLLTSVSTMSNIYDALIWRDGGGELTPALAESWEFVTPTALELRLRQGVTFHNGDPFTADDVVFTIERLLKSDPPLPARGYVAGLIESVEKVDTHTVRLHTAEPAAILLPSLVRVFIVPEKAFTELGEREFGRRPVGTGPFRFVRWDHNERIVLEAADDHWRGRASVDRLEIRPIPEAFSRWAALRSGEVDIMDNLPPERIRDIEADPNLKVAEVHSARNMFVGMNTHEPPFDNVLVRQAMNHAVNVEPIIRNVLQGQAYENPSVCSQPIFGYDPTVEGYEYDPEKAKALLAEAGYPDGFEVTMWGSSGRYLKDREVQEAIAGYLARVGVRVNHRILEWADLLSTWASHEMDGMVYIGTGNPLLDCDATMGYRFDLNRSPYSYYYITTPELTELIEKQEREVDVDQRLAIFKDIQQLIRNEAPWIFLWDMKDIYGVRAHIDWQPRPDEIIWGYDIGLAQ